MVSAARYRSWGGLEADFDRVIRPDSAPDAPPHKSSYLPYGNGRSYGDTCLTSGGTILDTRSINKVITFDTDAGILRAGSGLLLSDILDLIIPHGWFLPVTPGTSLVTLGGALANDVHGKNHHVDGTFGRFVRAFELLRSDGSRRICTPQHDAEFFAATIGGMGLTGLVSWVEIALKRIGSSDIVQTIEKFENIDAYFRMDCGHTETSTYSVAWIDGLARGRNLGRGLVIRGDHAPDGPLVRKKSRRFTIPFTPPVNVIPRAGLRLMNHFYMKQSEAARRVSCDAFFYPLDHIGHWNRLYGRSGFCQFQCAIPDHAAQRAIPELLETSLQIANGSGLVVLKKFGNATSPGILSFPMPGYTLTLDFPNAGEATAALVGQLASLALRAGGRVNPYKTSHMSRDVFEASFPHWRRIVPALDPMSRSRFSERLSLDYIRCDPNHAVLQTAQA